MSTTLTEKKSVKKSPVKKQTKKAEPSTMETTETSVETTPENKLPRFPFYKRYDALREFKRIFGLNYLPLDMLICFALHEVIIDIFKFEEQLKAAHPDFDWDHDSVQNAVLKYYGEEGLQLIHRMM
jgi:hypothetical protein